MPRPPITDESAATVARLYGEGLSMPQIAVSHGQVSNLLRGERSCRGFARAEKTGVECGETDR